MKAPEHHRDAAEHIEFFGLKKFLQAGASFPRSSLHRKTNRKSAPGLPVPPLGKMFCKGWEFLLPAPKQGRHFSSQNREIPSERKSVS
jgi:hypothetical protein